MGPSRIEVLEDRLSRLERKELGFEPVPYDLEVTVTVDNVEASVRACLDDCNEPGLEFIGNLLKTIAYAVDPYSEKPKAT